VKTWHVVFKTASGETSKVEFEAVSYSAKLERFVFVGETGQEVGWFRIGDVVGIYYID
jgi:hypothetical protein